VNYNTGRETFLLPVKWQNDWPVILKPGKSIPYVAAAPKLPNIHPDAPPLSGNFTWRDEFEAPVLDQAWLQVRTPQRQWFDLGRERGWLSIAPGVMPLDGPSNPTYLGRRQQHIAFEASTALRLPRSKRISGGLVAFQSQKHWYFLGCRRAGGSLLVFLEKKSGAEVQQVAAATVKSGSMIKLRISAEGGRYAFFYDAGSDGSDWRPLVEGDDGSILSTEVAGGFVGATVGPYARSDP
jgi:alpha-N-arabinofuranosidase